MFMMQVAIRVELKGNTEVDNEENQPTDPLGMPSKHPLTLKTHTPTHLATQPIHLYYTLTHQVTKHRDSLIHQYGIHPSVHPPGQKFRVKVNLVHRATVLGRWSVCETLRFYVFK